ncbi:succinate dehydrogenase assembly factor 2, partial [Klebsiella pneumoniae]|uniref:succinate dehydrogenase assembly factor 2 n=1 Tax=Klebsiella pneumoniae TaxID=573 RepID=UPI0030132D9F
DLSTEESKRRLFNRLIYRSKQRGYLELDLILGKWVQENITSMDESAIRSLVDVLDLENPDLWKWLTGQEQPPEAINSNPVFIAVRTKVMSNLDSHASP